MKGFSALVGMLAALLSVSTAQAAAGLMTSDVHLFSDGSAVVGAEAGLVTNDTGASMTLRTAELTPGDAVTVWWVVFNHPENCSGPAPGHPFQCGRSDLFVPSVGASVLYAAGHVIGETGTGDFGGHLAVGDTSGALFGPGLLAPRTAHIHLVVHDHGPARPDIVSQQIHTFGVCNPTCTDLQFAVFEQ